jgi:hypothetical protein
MGTKSRDRMYGAEVRISAQRAAAARKEADKLACDAWNKRMLGFRGPAQPSPPLGDALNAGYGYLFQAMGRREKEDDGSTISRHHLRRNAEGVASID